MAHTALYGGTVYEKKGGADLVGGTVYKKDHGKVLVGGTVYEVGFGHPVTVAAGASGMFIAQTTIGIDGNTYSVQTNAPAFNTVTQSTSKMTVTIVRGLGNPAVTLNGETIHTGVGECVIDLSDATHVTAVGMASALNITTYNINAVRDVTITVTGGGYSGLAQIEHNGIVYTGATKFTAKTGDLIRVSAKNPTTGNTDYYYLVTSDALVNMNYSTGGSGGATGSVGITTIPEGHALVTIDQQSYYLGGTFVSIDGVQYQKSATCVVPIGTVIYCHANAGNKEDKGSVSITLNGQEVSTVTQLGMGAVLGEYYYTVTRQAKIEMAYDEYDQTSIITITEQ